MTVDISKHRAVKTYVQSTGLEHVPYKTYHGEEVEKAIECLEYSGVYMINNKLYTYTSGTYAGFLRPVKRRTKWIRENESVIIRTLENTIEKTTPCKLCGLHGVVFDLT